MECIRSSREEQEMYTMKFSQCTILSWIFDIDEMMIFLDRAHGSAMQLASVRLKY